MDHQQFEDIITGAVCITIAGITYAIMRSQNSVLSIGRDTVVTASRDIVVTGKNSTLNQVSYFSAERQGPPSWVIRCFETGMVYTSQRSAALAMNLSEGHISQHLNGVRDHVNEFHFERLCMAL
jgi:hypothetical protein